MKAKGIAKAVLSRMGYEMRKIRSAVPGTDQRPVGQMLSFMEDIKARGLKCHTIIDVGAHKTGWSRMAKQVYPEAKIYMIEPQVEMKEYLDKFCREFSGSAYYLGGAGATSESKTLTVWPDYAGSSFLPAPDPDEQLRGRQRIIEIETIDAILAKNKLPTPELIKLDIQGYELEALKGATTTFGKTEVYVMEVSLFPFSDVPGIPLFADIVNFMLERKYVVYDFPGFLRRPLDGALGQCDVSFVKENSFLRRSADWA